MSNMRQSYSKHCTSVDVRNLSKNNVMWVLMRLLGIVGLSTSQREPQPQQKPIDVDTVTEDRIFELIEDPPLLDLIEPICYHQINGKSFSYFNVTFELEGICDKGEIDRCELEKAIAQYFNRALDCIPSNKVIFSGGAYYVHGYRDVLIYDIDDTAQHSTDECRVDVSLTAEVFLTMDSNNVGECGAHCPDNFVPSFSGLDASAFFPFAGGGGFRQRHLDYGGVKSTKRTSLWRGGVKRAKNIKKKAKSKMKEAKHKKRKGSERRYNNKKKGRESRTKGKTNKINKKKQLEEKSFYSPSNQPSSRPTQRPSQYPSISPTNYPSSSPSLISPVRESFVCDESLFSITMNQNGFGIDLVRYKSIEMVRPCDTLFACIKTFCADPGDGVCFDLRNF